MAGRARQIAPAHPPERANSKHVIDLYRVSIPITRTIADKSRSRRPSQPIRWQVLHKVIHRPCASAEALVRRAAVKHATCRAGHARARVAGSTACRTLRRSRQYGPSAGNCAACGATALDAAAASFALHFSIARRTALMSVPRIAPSLSTPPSFTTTNGAPLVHPACR